MSSKTKKIIQRMFFMYFIFFKLISQKICMTFPSEKWLWLKTQCSHKLSICHKTKEIIHERFRFSKFQDHTLPFSFYSNLWISDRVLWPWKQCFAFFHKLVCNLNISGNLWRPTSIPICVTFVWMWLRNLESHTYGNVLSCKWKSWHRNRGRFGV